MEGQSNMPDLDLEPLLADGPDRVGKHEPLGALTRTRSGGHLELLLTIMLEPEIFLYIYSDFKMKIWNEN